MLITKHYNIDISWCRPTVKHNTNKNYYNYDKVKIYNWIKIILSCSHILIKKIYYNLDKKIILATFPSNIILIEILLLFR